MKVIVSDSFYPLLEDRHRYLVLCGGAGSGKSEFAAIKIFYRCMKEGNHRFLSLRKVRNRVHQSNVQVMLTLLENNSVPFDFNKSERIITFFSSDGKKNEILFDGLDDPKKIKSIKGITGMHLEETTEFTREDFLQLDLRLREPGPEYHQIILTFNPDEEAAPWLKEMFFEHRHPDATVHVSTLDDNPIPEVRERYRKQLEDLKDQDETMYSIYALGQWAKPRGRIYNWDVVSLPQISFDEVFYGGDFGYASNPAAVVRIYRKADEFWVEEIIYQCGLTNDALASEMLARGVDKSGPIYFDAAEPKSIEELFRYGFNVLPSVKGKDSVRAGIKYLQSKKIHIVEGSENIIREASKYKWRVDKNGNEIPEPVKFYDHLLDAIRYGIFTHMTQASEPRIWRV